ncbi:lipocalin family protein [Rufibacter immobilis]|uniref:lipocalin family protein n=1 Tax=Rufibacter immobilis TaxID=1348778 RepID=UPI0035ED23A9
MNKSRLLPLLFCLLTLAASCGDDDEEVSQNEQRLVAKQWQLTTVTLAGGLIPGYSSEGAEPCQQNDFFEFRNDKTFIYDEGATKCNDLVPQQTQGTWSIAGNILRISGEIESLDLPLSDLDLTIKEITNTSMTLTFTDTVLGTGAPGTVTMTAK